MTPEQIEGMKRAVLRGTPGPWVWEFSGSAGRWLLFHKPSPLKYQAVQFGGPPSVNPSVGDMGLIARAPDMASHILALTAEIDRLRAKVEAADALADTLLATAGVCEIAARNPSVMEYMRHWEGRAEAAEARLAEVEAERDTLKTPKWDVQHTDTMNDIVSMGLARDAAEARMAEVQAERDRLREAHERIVQWSEAYPIGIFPEPDLKAADRALAASGMRLDAISASNMRHAIEGAAKIARAALSTDAQEGRDTHRAKARED